MLGNEFADRNYSCGDSCQCMFVTPLVDQCMIAGQGVPDQYGYKPGHTGRNVGIMIAIIAGYRIAGWIVLELKKYRAIVVSSFSRVAIGVSYSYISRLFYSARSMKS